MFLTVSKGHPQNTENFKNPPNGSYRPYKHTAVEKKMDLCYPHEAPLSKVTAQCKNPFGPKTSHFAPKRTIKRRPCLDVVL